MVLATVDKLLTTTRTVRKRLDLTRPVDPEIIQTCLEIAIHAPNGGNIPRYHFVVVTDEAKRTDLAALYNRAYLEVYSPQRQAEVSQSDPRLIESATYLAEHMHEVPVLIIPCVEAPSVQGTGPGAYASILPATWSLMLALRARGVGSAWTTLHLRYEKEAASLLGIPDADDKLRELSLAALSLEGADRTQRVVEMLQELEREPTVEELADKVGMTPARVREIMRISQDPLSLDSPVGEEDDSNLADFIEDAQAEAPAEIAARMMLNSAVLEALGELNEREQQVVRLRFGLEDGQARTLEEVGKEFGVTRERIRQIESKTLAKLRHPHRSQKLRDYLDGE